MAKPTIEVRANYLGKIPGFDPYYHLLIVVRDGHGNNTYYRGGSDGDVSPIGGAIGITKPSVGSPGTGGKIIAEFGPYVYDSIDFDRGAKVIYKAELNPADLPKIHNYFDNQIGAINRAKINYYATGPNSNSTAGTLLRNVGINIKIPGGMWIPGFEQQLVNQNGKRVATAVKETSTYASNTATSKSYQNLNAGEIKSGNSDTQLAFNNNTNFATSNNIQVTLSESDNVSGEKNKSVKDDSSQKINSDQTNSSTDVSKVVTLLKNNAADVKKQYGLDVTTDEGLSKAVMQYWKENNLDPKILKEQLPNIKESEIAITNSKATSSVESWNVTDSKADLSKVVALLKNNAAEVKKQSGLDVTTDDGLGRAVMQYWKENNLDPKTLKEQLPNIKDSEFAIASAALTNNNAVETTKAKDLAVQR
jgi:DNA-directed RNA polymerase subunit H (RpoH/RPB5)